MLGLAQRTALGDFHRITLFGVVLLIMSMKNGAALKVLAVLGVAGLVVDHDLDRLMRLVRSDDALDGSQQRTFGFLLGGLSHTVLVTRSFGPPLTKVIRRLL